MVTDYSSIAPYMDFTAAGQAVLFLVPHIEQYVRKDRQMQFDFDAMAPGPKLTDWTALTETLLAQWRHDAWADARAGLRSTILTSTRRCRS